MKKITKILVSLILVASSATALRAADFKKGNWEMTYTTTMEGMPMEMDIPVKTKQECIDSDDFIPESGDDGECTHSSKKTSSNKMEWNIRCKNDAMTGKGEMEFSGNTMKGNMEMKMDMMGQKMNINVVIEGKYIGACK